MVGISNIGDLEMRHLDTLAIQDEVKFHARRSTRVSGVAIDIGAAQPGGFHKQEDFIFTPERIEIAGHDDWFFALFDELIQVPQLKMAVPVFK